MSFCVTNQSSYVMGTKEGVRKDPRRGKASRIVSIAVQ